MRIEMRAVAVVCLTGLLMGCASELAGDAAPATSVEAITCGRTTCALANATATCSRGRCAISSCFTYRGDCNHVDADGCEVNIGTDVNNCGGCGTACPSRPNATRTCGSGVCGFTCNRGYADCDGVAANGCEVNTGADANNCGACGRSCGIDPYGGVACCNGTCAPTHFDVNNCGGCGVACAAPDHATATCNYPGTCGYYCSYPYNDCDRNTANGCETNVAGDDANNCGGCGISCGPGATCSSGRCICPPGQYQCYDPSSGGYRCTDVSGDPNNCGGCGISCGPGGTCSGGTCACGADQTNCYGRCTDLNSDYANCGACGNYCNPGFVCTAGACTPSVCPPGYVDCGGRCADVNSDPGNCGACGVVCRPGALCQMGRCF